MSNLQRNDTFARWLPVGWWSKARGAPLSICPALCPKLCHRQGSQCMPLPRPPWIHWPRLWQWNWDHTRSVCVSYPGTIEGQSYSPFLCEVLGLTVIWTSIIIQQNRVHSLPKLRRRGKSVSSLTLVSAWTDDVPPGQLGWSATVVRKQAPFR